MINYRMSKDMKKVYDKYQGITFTKSVLESAKKQIDEAERQEQHDNAEENNENAIHKENEDMDVFNREDNHEIKVNVNI